MSGTPPERPIEDVNEGQPQPQEQPPPPPQKGTVRNSATSVAMSATINLSESRKYNFDVTGAASIEAKLVSVPAPEAFKAFIQSSLAASSKKSE